MPRRWAVAPLALALGLALFATAFAQEGKVAGEPQAAQAEPATAASPSATPSSATPPAPGAPAEPVAAPKPAEPATSAASAPVTPETSPAAGQVDESHSTASPAVPPSSAQAVVPPPPAVEPADPPAPQAGPAGDDKPGALRITGWIGVATTVALLTTGAIFGLAAQERSDEVSRRQIFTDASGQPPAYTATEEQKIKDLRDQGMLYNNLGIGLMAASAATAVTSAVLFILDRRAHKGAEARTVRISPSLSPKGGGLAASIEF